MKEWFSEAQIRAIKVNKMTIVIRDQSTSMTQSIGESFGCALVLCYLALMIKWEFQIRPAMLFILHYERNIICGSSIKNIYIYIYIYIL